MAEILSQDEIDALLSATEGDASPGKAETPEDIEKRRREELRSKFVRTGNYNFKTRKYTYVEKYTAEEIEEIIAEERREAQMKSRKEEEETREAQIKRRKEELQNSYIEIGNMNYRKQYTDKEIEAIMEEEFEKNKSE